MMNNFLFKAMIITFTYRYDSNLALFFCNHSELLKNMSLYFVIKQKKRRTVVETNHNCPSLLKISIFYINIFI